MVLDGGSDPLYRSMVGAGGGRLVYRVEVWWSGVRVDSFGDAGLPVDAGTVSASIQNRSARNFSAMVPAEYFPYEDTSLLSPLGAELRVWCGWRFGSMPVWMFPVFVGPVVSAGPISPWSASFTLSATDLGDGVAADRFLVPQAAGVGKLATDRVRQLVRETYPEIGFGRFDEQYTVVPDGTWDSDRAGACDGLAKAASCVWFFTAGGLLTWRRIPWTLTSFDVADVTIGTATGLNSLEVSRSRDDVFNVVVVRGESGTADVPVSAVAMDLDEDSPTYVDGPLGGRVLELSEDVSSVAQAQSLARQRLARSRAVRREISGELVTDPSLELGDIVDLVVADWRIRAALTSLSIQIAGGRPTMSCTFREAEGVVEDAG